MISRYLLYKYTVLKRDSLQSFHQFLNTKNLFLFFKPMLPKGFPWVPSKKFSLFGPTAWPAIANIYIYERRALLYRLFMIFLNTKNSVILKMLNKFENTSHKYIHNNQAFRTLRVHLLFQHLTVALSVSVFSLRSIRKKQKNVCGFRNIFNAFSKFYKNKKLFNTNF